MKKISLLIVCIGLTGCFTTTQVRHEAVPVSAGMTIEPLQDGRFSVSAEWLQDVAKRLEACR